MTWSAWRRGTLVHNDGRRVAIFNPAVTATPAKSRWARWQGNNLREAIIAQAHKPFENAPIKRTIVVEDGIIAILKQTGLRADSNLAACHSPAVDAAAKYPIDAAVTVIGA